MRPSKLHFQEYGHMPQAIVLDGIRVLPKQVLHKAIEELSSGVLTKVMDQDLYGGYWEE